MTTHVALLRAVNVGGHNKVAMADLRDLFGELGFADAATVLQSGNVVFRGGRRSAAALEPLLEKNTADRLGVSCDYVVRSAAELQGIVGRNPFPKEATTNPGRLHVMFLKAAPSPGGVEAVVAATKGPEVLRADGRQLYLVYPAGIGASKLTGTLIERKLGVRGTARNWNTVLKLAAMCR